MRLLKKYVLVEQRMVEKKSKVVLLDKTDDREKFDFSFKILDVSPNCSKELQVAVGEIPIFRKHVQFEGLKVIEKNKQGMLSHVLVYEDDIIGIDDEKEN